MEQSIKGLIERLSKRKNSEMAYFTKYKNEELQELMLISSGKIIEIDNVIAELKQLIKYKSKNNSYRS
jgi:hypothetical protein